MEVSLVYRLSFFFFFNEQDMVVEPEQEKAARKESIQNLYAFDLFCQKKFDDSLQLFAQLETG